NRDNVDLGRDHTMIWESGPWKRDIARRVARLKRRQRQRRWLEASLASVEQDIFSLAYAVRKLIEAGKVSDEVEAEPLSALEYHPLGRTVDIMNWHKLDELYDLETHKDKRITLRDFCNQIIHSFIFLPSMGESGGLDGFFVASDRTKDRRLPHFKV